MMNLLRILWSLIDDLDFGKILHEKMYCYFVFFLETLGLLQDATWHLDGLLKSDLSLPLFS